MNYKLFTTPPCKFCPTVKEFMVAVNMKGEVIDAATPSGMAEAVKYGVRSVPTVIFLENGTVMAVAHSINEIKSVLSASA